MPFVETADRTRLAYDDWGTGEPVVLVHGWALCGEVWEYQAVHLADQGLRCVAYDRRGCGRSDRPGRGHDCDTLADDLAAVIEGLDLSGVTLVAHSMGAGEVARYLSRRGAGRVARAVLLAPTTPFLLRTADNPDGFDLDLYDGMRAALTMDRPAFMAASAPGFFGPGPGGDGLAASPEMARWAIDMALRSSPKTTLDTIRTFSETDFRPEMGAFTVPTLVVHGDADANVPLDLCGRRTAAAIPGSRLLVYEGAAHGLHLTHKDRLNRDLLAFVRG